MMTHMHEKAPVKSPSRARQDEEEIKINFIDQIVIFHFLTETDLSLKKHCH